MILPQGRRARVLQHLEGADGIGGEQHTARQGGAAQSQPADDAVVEAVHRAVGAPRRRGAEGGERVLQLVRRRPAVRDDQRPGHCWLSSVSAFLGSIQSGSFSMSCTRAMSSGWGRTPWRYAAYCSAPMASPSTFQCCRAYWPMRRLNLRSGTLSQRSLSVMNMLRRSISFTISWRYRPREASFSFCLSASAWFSRSS